MANETKKIKLLLSMIKMAEQMNDEWISTLNKCLGSTAEEKESVNRQVVDKNRIDDKE